MEKLLFKKILKHLAEEIDKESKRIHGVGMKMQNTDYHFAASTTLNGISKAIEKTLDAIDE